MKSQAVARQDASGKVSCPGGWAQLREGLSAGWARMRGEEGGMPSGPEEATEKKQRPGHPELSELFSGAWEAGDLQERQSNLRQGGVERCRDTAWFCPLGFSVDIGQGWRQRVREKMHYSPSKGPGESEKCLN